jgi:hypothetical protein
MNEFYAWVILGIVYAVCAVCTILICLKENK